MYQLHRDDRERRLVYERFRHDRSGAQQPALRGDDPDAHRLDHGRGRQRGRRRIVRRLRESAGGGGCTAGGAVFERFLASTPPTLIATPGLATGGGQILHPDHIVFGFNAKSDSADRFQGECLVNDQPADVVVKCLDVTFYSQIGNTAILSGQATVNGVPTGYQIEATDVDDSGIGTDTFSIETDSGYSASGVLTEGNIQVHEE